MGLVDAVSLVERMGSLVALFGLLRVKYVGGDVDVDVR